MANEAPSATDAGVGLSVIAGSLASLPLKSASLRYQLRVEPLPVPLEVYLKARLTVVPVMPERSTEEATELLLPPATWLSNSVFRAVKAVHVVVLGSPV